MRPRLLPVLAVVLTAGIGAGTIGGPARADDPRRPVEVALLADTPYGDAQRAQFPALVADVNADPGISLVLHGGDIKNGSSTCDDVRFADIAAQYGTFQDPFVFTPGDNEWTDCHRASNGGFLPTERLEAVRSTFFPRPGRTLGQRAVKTTTQAKDREHSAYVENVRLDRAGVVIASVHVVGSQNDLVPWFGAAETAEQRTARLAEFAARQAANLAWIDEAFATAVKTRAPGVLLLMQAEPVVGPGYQAVRDRIVEQSRTFGRPVLLVHGDEHAYEQEPAYAGVPNLTRLETYGDTAVNWLELTIDPAAREVFSWESRLVGQPDATG